MKQESLFQNVETPLVKQRDNIPPVRRQRAHPESRAAFNSIRGHLPQLDASLVRFMRENFNIGWTCDEIEVALLLSHQTASSALKRLKDSKIVIETDRTRATRSGRRARVVVLAEEGK